MVSQAFMDFVLRAQNTGQAVLKAAGLDVEDIGKKAEEADGKTS
jgi:hypothetical protein